LLLPIRHAYDQEIKEKLEGLKKKYFDAKHHCYADVNPRLTGRAGVSSFWLNSLPSAKNHKHMNLKDRLNFFIWLGCVTGPSLFAHASDTLQFSRREVLIPMRDGIRLNTVIFAPKTKEAVPIVFLRTPYGVSDIPSPNKNSYVSDMAKQGYLFVYQDM